MDATTPRPKAGGESALVPFGACRATKETTMTMLFDPVPRTLFVEIGNRLRAAAEAIGRLCHAIAGHLMRRYVRQALRSVNDRRPPRPASRVARSTVT